MFNKVRDYNNWMKEQDVHRKDMPTAARILDIQSELGELSKEYLKQTKYGTEDFVLNDDFVLEIGDCLYSLLSLSDELGIDANFALDRVIEKYKRRVQNKNNMGSGR